MHGTGHRRRARPAVRGPGRRRRASRNPVVGRRRRPRRDPVVVHAVQRLRRDLPGRDRAGADHQPASPPAGRGRRARPRAAVDARGDPQVGQLVRREQAQARPVDRRARLRRSPTPARSRSTCSGSSATTPRSTRARSASRGRSPGCSTRPASTSGSSTTASATRATTSAGSARRACSRCSPSSNIATLSGCEFNRIVTTDPHSLNTLRNEYPTLGGEWPVIHHTALPARADRLRRRSDFATASPTASPTTTPATSGGSTASTRRPARFSSGSAARWSRCPATATTRSAAAPAAGGSGSPTSRAGAPV